jgi:5'-methylthioadenosine phosphorylase
VVGGSGLYAMEGLGDLREVRVKTPFGDPSDAILVGELDGVAVAFLPRHGRGHVLGPSELPARANIFALKSLGVERVISVSAVGSLKDGIHPLEMVVPDQLIDRTRVRPATFFQDGIVAHVGMADPFCPDLREALIQGVQETVENVHTEGVYVVIEGPTFSTRAESFLFRSWGASVIGMTAMPEAKLAREAEMCYATLACVTDYDVWHTEQADVSVEAVIANLRMNVATAQEVLRKVIPRVLDERGCECGTALDSAVITAPERIAPEARERLSLLLGDRFGNP